MSNQDDTQTKQSGDSNFNLMVNIKDTKDDTPLVVGRAYILEVSLQFPDRPIVPSELPESVDVLLVCGYADVHHLTQKHMITDTLVLDGKSKVEFQFTPRVEGVNLELTVALLIKNEPIHRARYTFDSINSPY